MAKTRQPASNQANTDAPPTPRKQAHHPVWPFKKLLEALKELKPDEAPVLYVYRAAPKINRQLSGKKGSQIDRLIPPMPADIPAYLRATHGGGVYDIWLNADNRDDTGICKGRVEIPTTEVDPILDPRELVRGDVQNEQLIQKWMLEGKVKQDSGGLIVFTNNSDREQPSKDYATSRLVDVAIESMKNKEEKPNSMLEIIQVLTALQKAQPAAPAGPDMTNVLMKMLDNQTAEANSLRAEIRALSTAKVSEADPVDNAERMIAFAREMNPNSKPAGPDWGQIIAGALAAATPFLMKFAGMANAAPAVAENPAAAPAPAAAAANATASADTERVLTAAIRAIVRGDSGADFAESFMDMWTEEHFQQLAAYGPVPLVHAISIHPLWLATPIESRGQDQPQKFIEQFITGEDEPGKQQAQQPDTPPEPPPPPPPAKPTTRQKREKVQ